MDTSAISIFTCIGSLGNTGLLEGDIKSESTAHNFRSKLSQVTN